MQEYGVSRGTVSWSVSMVAIVMAAFAIPAGVVAAKIGIKRVFAIGAFLLAAGVLTPVCSNFALFLMTRFLFAVGTAMTFPIAGGIVTQWFSTKELPLVNGLNMSATSVGNAIALFATVPIVAALSWRAPLTIYGAIAFVSALAWLILGKERPKATKPGPQVTQHPPMTVGSALKQRTTLLLAFSMAGPFCLFMAISSWLPAYYNEVFNMPLARASSITAIFTLFGIPACILGGILPMRFGLRKPFLLIPGILIGFAGLGTFMVNNQVVIFTSVAIFGVCIWIHMPSIFTIAMEMPNATPQTVAVVLAVALAVGNIGGFLGPLIVGYLTDLTGSYLPGLVLCCVFSWSLFIGGRLLPETGPKAKRMA